MFENVSNGQMLEIVLKRKPLEFAEKWIFAAAKTFPLNDA
jgi:hypothetical protein